MIAVNDSTFSTCPYVYGCHWYALHNCTVQFLISWVMFLTLCVKAVSLHCTVSLDWLCTVYMYYIYFFSHSLKGMNQIGLKCCTKMIGACISNLFFKAYFYCQVRIGVVSLFCLHCPAVTAAMLCCCCCFFLPFLAIGHRCLCVLGHISCHVFVFLSTYKTVKPPIYSNLCVSSLCSVW